MTEYAEGDALLTDRQREIWAAYLKSGENMSATANALNVRRPDLQKSIKRIRRRLRAGVEVRQERTRYDQSGNVRSKSVTLAPASQGAPDLPDHFELAKVTQHVKDGEVVQHWPRYKPASLTPEATAATLRAALSENFPRITPTPFDGGADGNLHNVIPVADGHFGVHAWGAETGHDYDLKIAKRLHDEAFGDLLARMPRAKTGLLIGMGDQLHANGIRPATPASGNLLDVDSRYPKALSVVTKWFRDSAVAMLDTHEHLTVKILKGNHDEDASVAIQMALAMYFEDEPRVTVDESPDYWYYHRFGNCFNAYHHGHQIKPIDMPIHVADRRKKDWGECEFVGVFHGHFHRAGLTMVGQTPVECLPTLTAADAYSAPRYTNRRGMIGITYHRERGEHSRHSVWLNDGALRPLSAA